MKKLTAKLSLHRDTIRKLTAPELSRPAGGTRDVDTPQDPRTTTVLPKPSGRMVIRGKVIRIC